MLLKMKQGLSNTNSILSTTKFKLVFIGIIIINIYGFVMVPENLNNIYEGILDTFSSSIYISFLLLLLTLNIGGIVETFDKNYAYIIRFKTKGEYYKVLIKRVIVLNLIVIISSILFCMIAMILKFPGQFQNGLSPFYDISIILYLLIYIVKVSIILLLLTIIIVLIMKLLNKILSVAISFALSLTLLFYPHKVFVVTSFKEFSFFIGYYLSLNPYSSLMLELSHFFLICTILIVICLILYKLILKFHR